jgi:type I restriction enzyme S subunit
MDISYKIEPLNLVCSEIIDCVNKTAPVVDYETPYKMIRTTNVKSGRVDISTVRYVTEETFKKWTRRTKPKRNDIILTREAPLGEVGLLRSDDNIFLGQRLIQYRVNPSIMDQLFLYYAFQDDFMQGQIRSYGSGATVEHLRIGDCETIKVKYPPLPIQQKIASILSSYDELIENNKQRIKLLEEMAEDIYKEWFVRLRFPDYEKTKIVDGLPEGWEKSTIKNYLEFYIGGGWGEDSPSGKNETPAYVIRGTDIPNAKIGNLNFDVLRYHSISNLSSRKLQINDIVFEVSGGTESQSLGRTLLATKALLDRFDNDVICASFCKLIRVKPEMASGLYIYSLLNRLYKTEEIALYQVQSTGISNYKFEDFIGKHKIIFPHHKIQYEFEKIVQPMFDEIQLLGSKNQLLKGTRDLLLPRLISGKLSVEHLVEEELKMVAEPGAEYK